MFLRAASVFALRGSATVSVNQSRHRDLLKTKAEAVDPASDLMEALGRLRKWGRRSHSRGRPMRRCELSQEFFAPRPPGSFSGDVIPGLNFADIRELVQAIGRQLLADQKEFFLDLTGRADVNVSLYSFCF